MFLYLLLLFTILPIVELALLIKIGQVIHVGPTIGLVLATGVVGAWLARSQGAKTYRSINAELQQGRLPGDQMIDALLIFMAGAVLITPGVITDTAGFLLLIPPARALVRKRLKKMFSARFVITDFSGFHASRPDDDLIDVEARPVDDDEDAEG